MSLKACHECGKELSSEAEACPHCGAKASKPTSALAWITAIVGGVIVFSCVAGMVDKPGIRGPSAEDIARQLHGQAVANLKLEKFSWSKSGFGNIMIANFTLRNTGALKIKDVSITCTSYGPSGTAIDTNTRTIFETFPPGKPRRIREFNMGFQHSQASSASCVVSDLNLL